MIRPSILLLILNQNVSNPPMNNEEAANRPHKNALVYVLPLPVRLCSPRRRVDRLIDVVHDREEYPVDKPHMRMPVNPSIGASPRHGFASTSRRSQWSCT